MTNVTVTQADRDAVQAFHKEMGQRLMSDIRHGTKLLDAKGLDDDPIYQAFARHRIAVAADTTGSPDGMGVTGNAILLLGYIGGAVSRDGVYEVESADTVTGVQLIRHCRTGNLYSVAVRQIEGVE